MKLHEALSGLQESWQVLQNMDPGRIGITVEILSQLENIKYISGNYDAIRFSDIKLGKCSSVYDLHYLVANEFARGGRTDYARILVGMANKYRQILTSLEQIEWL